MSALLVLDRVACIRGDRLLFERLSLSLAAGDLLWVRGPNGTGKSSLLRLVAGLLRPAAGTVKRHARCALVDEAAALDSEQSVRRALDLWARIDGIDAAVVTEAMAAMGLERLRDVPVAMLSTGQRKRAALARVIASGAPLWLLDEPANGMDAAARDRLSAAIAAHRAGGGAVLLASHFDLGLAHCAVHELAAVAA